MKHIHGNPEGRDSYSKECIDTLTAYLSECPETIVFIIGYKEALDKCFFDVNKGVRDVLVIGSQ